MLSRTQLKILPFALGLAVWAIVAVYHYLRAPVYDASVHDLLLRLFGGIAMGFPFALGTLVVAYKVAGVALIETAPPKSEEPPHADEPAPPAPSGVTLQDTLAEIEAVRQHTEAAIGQRMRRIPLFMALGAGAWLVYSQLLPWLLGLLLPSLYSSPRPSQSWFASLVLLLFFAALGGGGGYYWAWRSLDRAYGKLYKERVLPKLAASFRTLKWRRAQPPLDQFRRYHLYPKSNYAEGDDEIYGTYRGLPLSIFDFHLLSNASKSTLRMFDGVVIALPQPRGVHGVVVVARSNVDFYGLGQHLFSGLQAVHLESPEFAEGFLVHATDQVSARALLTPAFMERFTKLLRYGALLADGQRLFFAVPMSDATLFKPPNYRDPAAVRKSLLRLHESIATCLRIVDDVIDLDQSTRQQAAPAAAGTREQP